MVNALLMSIHNNWAQIFILPVIVINNIDKMCRFFLWHGKANEVKIGYVDWDQVCTSNNYGGLGFRNIRNWNKAVIGNVWHIGTNKNDLLVKWVHTLYI